MHRFAIAICLALVPALSSDAYAGPPAPPTPPTFPGIPAIPGLSFAFGHGQGRLGAEVSSMTPELRSFFGAPTTAGILVQRVLPKSAAEDAGVRVGDVLIGVDGDDVGELGDVAAALADRKKGDSVAVVVVRKKRKQTLTATLGDDPANVWSQSFGSWSSDDAVLEKLESIERRLDALEEKRSRKPKRRRSPKKSK